VDVPGRHQGLLHAGRPPFPVRRPALPGHLHLVDVQRAQAERHLQRVRAAGHLLHAKEPGRLIYYTPNNQVVSSTTRPTTRLSHRSGLLIVYYTPKNQVVSPRRSLDRLLHAKEPGRLTTPVS